MLISQQGIILIQFFEKLSITPYVDSVGIWTIGWGHVLYTAAGQRIDERIFGAVKARQLAEQAMTAQFGNWTITRAQADERLNKDLLYFEQSVEKAIGLGNASQAQFDALTSFAFNVGIANFTTSTVERLHVTNHREIGDISLHGLYQSAVNHASPINMAIAFVRWCMANGQISLGLFRRRVAELLLYSGWDATKAYTTAESFTP